MSESVTRSPIELFWTAKNNNLANLIIFCVLMPFFSERSTEENAEEKETKKREEEKKEKMKMSKELTVS